MTQPQLPLADRAALVTGGGSGIGLGCALRFAAEGAHVTVAGRGEDRLKAAVAELEAVAAPGARVGYVVADVTDEDQTRAAVEHAASLGRPLTAVVASAGGNSTMGPITLVDTQKWRDTVDLNVTGTMLVLKHGARHMVRAGGGSFVAISSVASAATHRWFGAYGVAKAGIDHLVRLAADELGASRVRVNSIRPGLVRTEMVETVTAGGPVLDDYLACTPLGRIGEPADIAALAAFLVGPESTWLTGQTISADGGHHLRRGPDYRPVLEPLFGPEALRGAVDG
ncbi:SDR family oxidoreductase [Yinghuangia sp. ASG 101]|uniref:SDR family oxidoreductase n=1 Tax=Yinghuangia sp. ASG 101 TaxID=2896848 RepID=UPI001E5F1B3F|nr:SDR family oxidoreductase [Yinghuangia sp. ASG 101]UGQ14762.1 SDR family oxidoreductase [Yinghuangia sp. ASG 101]